MINPFVQVVEQSKKGMAFWFERGDLLTADERGARRGHLPATSLFRGHRLREYLAGRTRSSSSAASAASRAGADRLDVHGRRVARGARVADVGAGEWIVQDRFETLPVRIDGEAAHPCHGAYLVGGPLRRLLHAGRADALHHDRRLHGGGGRAR